MTAEPKRRRKPGPLRLAQIACALFFVGWVGAAPGPDPWDGAFFLRLDPIAAAITMLASRQWIVDFWPALALLVVTPLLGRFFCATLCPLGATIDFTDRLFGPKSNRRKLRHPAPGVRWRRARFGVMAFLLGAASLGVSLVFLASPLSMSTRFYGTVFWPATRIAADAGLVLLRPLATRFDFSPLVYAQMEPRRFALTLFTALTLAAVFAGIRWSPRFWCRYLCPAGALLSLAGWRPLVRRRVTADCIQCGRCVASCPMSAIGGDAPFDSASSPSPDPFLTDHGGCIACQTCVRTCPVDAVRFVPAAPWEDGVTNAFARPGGSSDAVLDHGRRRFLVRGLSGMGGAVLAGAGAALVARVDLRFREAEARPGDVLYPGLIRPPASLPEPEFLQCCLRCGACMAACPTNTLQPIALDAGSAAALSPVVTPDRGPCDPRCHRCADVCPSGAIRVVSPEERVWARIGTAHILPHKCLAWEFDRKCLVCDEVCPFNAIDAVVLPGRTVPVPVIREDRCAGCGFCQYHCPVQAQPAIVVEPMEAIRMASGSFEETARTAGLELRLGRHEKAVERAVEGGLPPGFTE